MLARVAKNAFEQVIDTVFAKPVLNEKHGRGVDMVISVGEYERLSVLVNDAGKDAKLLRRR
jgi:hypothetical protein